MGLTYFKRYRMEVDLHRMPFGCPVVPPEYRLLAWNEALLEAHADTKYRSFCFEIDANVFPCLGDREGCLRLMSEITRRDNFVPEATWLLMYDHPGETVECCGTIQGLRDYAGLGAVQNVGVVPGHRGKGLGTYLLYCGLRGFRDTGIRQAYLEVTAQNTGAVRLYQRLGFREVKTVYKASDVALA